MSSKVYYKNLRNTFRKEKSSPKMERMGFRKFSLRTLQLLNFLKLYKNLQYFTEIIISYYKEFKLKNI